MNKMRNYMKEVKQIRSKVTDSYNNNQLAQYETSKEAYIKKYYKDYGTNRDSREALPQIDEYLDAEFEGGDFNKRKS